MTYSMWKPVKKEPPTYYYSLDLDPDCYLALLDLLENRKCPERAAKRIYTAVLAAQQLEGPMVKLPWKSVRDEARRQGVSEADIVFDLMGGGSLEALLKQKEEG